MILLSISIWSQVKLKIMLLDLPPSKPQASAAQVPITNVDLLQLAITTILYITGPMLLVGLLVGVLISVVQAATQVQEVTLVFIPKMLAVGFVMWMLGPWMFEELNILIDEVASHVTNVITGGY